MVEQTQREREAIIEEMDVERSNFKEQINQLEDALNLANVEISRLTIELADINDSQQKLRRISTNTTNTTNTTDSRSSMEIMFSEKVCLKIINKCVCTYAHLHICFSPSFWKSVPFFFPNILSCPVIEERR